MVNLLGDGQSMVVKRAVYEAGVKFLFKRIK